jgi:hypothetical protein
MEHREIDELRRYVWETAAEFEVELLSLAELIARLQGVEATIPSSGKATASLQWRYGEGWVAVRVSYMRPETDEECARRVGTEREFGAILARMRAEEGQGLAR